MTTTTFSIRGNEEQRKPSSTLDDEEVRAHLMKLRAAYEKKQGIHNSESSRTRRGTGRRREPKGIITIRISQHVLTAFRATGKGWQARMDAALCEVVTSGRIVPQTPAEAEAEQAPHAVE